MPLTTFLAVWRGKRERKPENFWTDMLRDHLTEQRVGVGVENANRQELADLAAIALEDDDPVAIRAARQLQAVAQFVAFLGRFARSFGEHRHLAAEEGPLVLP